MRKIFRNKELAVYGFPIGTPFRDSVDCQIANPTLHIISMREDEVNFVPGC